MKIPFCIAGLSYVLAVVTLLVSMPLFAGTPPDSIYGNYVGMGKCAPDTPKPCTDTGPMDTIYLQRLDIKETDWERQNREGFGLEKHDIRVSIRILHKYGHKCTFKQDMYWAGDHLKFFPKAPYRQKVCKLELWLKEDVIVLKDPGNACGCSVDRETVFDGRRFKKGPDPLLAAYRKSTTPPPASIFGKYRGTGECATDERETEFCMEDYNVAQAADYIDIVPAEKAGVRVEFGSTRKEGGDYYCLQDAKAVWLEDHLIYFKETPENPGTPHILQFWFKDNTVVVRNIWSKHCGTYVHSSLFRKSAGPVSIQDIKR